MGLVEPLGNKVWKITSAIKPAKGESESAAVSGYTVVTVKLLFHTKDWNGSRDLMIELGCISNLEHAKVIGTENASTDEVSMVARFKS